MDLTAFENSFAVLLPLAGVRSPLTIFFRVFLPLAEGFDILGLALGFFLIAGLDLGCMR